MESKRVYTDKEALDLIARSIIDLRTDEDEETDPFIEFVIEIVEFTDRKILRPADGIVVPDFPPDDEVAT